MKRLYIGMLSIIISFSMIGCSTTKNISNSSEPVTTTETTAKVTTAEVTQITTVELPLETVSVEKTLLEKAITDEDDSVLINASYELPVIKNTTNNAVIQKINDYYKAASDEWFNQLETVTKKSVKEDKALDPENFTINTMERSFEVTYNKCGILSFLQLEYVNSGAAHPNTTRIAETFDLDTGEPVLIGDILNGTADEINAMIAEGFTAMVREQPKSYFSDAKKIIADGNPYGGFYLTDSAMKIFYQTEVIAPYAAGYLEIALDYTDTAKFKISLKQAIS